MKRDAFVEQFDNDMDSYIQEAEAIFAVLHGSHDDPPDGWDSFADRIERAANLGDRLVTHLRRIVVDPDRYAEFYDAADNALAHVAVGTERLRIWVRIIRSYLHGSDDELSEAVSDDKWRFDPSAAIDHWTGRDDR